MMASVKKKNTKPEVIVRSFLHRQGLRFTLHDKRLPGTPDIVFPRCRTVPFIHGCFWHQCPHCAAGKKEVRTNTAYWLPKLARNRARDVRVKAELEAQGWTVHTIWECEAAEPSALARLAKLLHAKSLPARELVP